VDTSGRDSKFTLHYESEIQLKTSSWPAVNLKKTCPQWALNLSPQYGLDTGQRIPFFWPSQRFPIYMCYLPALVGLYIGRNCALGQDQGLSFSQYMDWPRPANNVFVFFPLWLKIISSAYCAVSTPLNVYKHKSHSMEFESMLFLTNHIPHFETFQILFSSDGSRPW